MTLSRRSAPAHTRAETPRSGCSSAGENSFSVISQTGTSSDVAAGWSRSASWPMSVTSPAGAGAPPANRGNSCPPRTARAATGDPVIACRRAAARGDCRAPAVRSAWGADLLRLVSE